jgi:hypothetical protein
MYWSNAPKCVESRATAVDPAPQTVCARAAKVALAISLDGDDPGHLGGQVAAGHVADVVLVVTVLGRPPQ